MYDVIVYRTAGTRWTAQVDDRQEATALAMVLFGFKNTARVEVWEDGEKIAQLPLPMTS